MVKKLGLLSVLGAVVLFLFNLAVVWYVTVSTTSTDNRAVGVSASEPPKRIFYISPSGNDSNSGGMQSPWKTITKANAVIQPGDKVVIASGTYTGQAIRPANSGKVNERIIYEASGEVIVESSNTLINLVDRSYVAIIGPYIFRNPGSEWVVMRNGTRNTIDGATFIGKATSSYSGVNLGSSLTYTVIKNSTFRDWGKTEGQWGDAMRIEGATYTLIENNQFVNAGHALLDLNSSHNIVRGNLFENNWQKSLDLVTRSVLTEYNVIENNVFKLARPASNGSNGGMGLQLSAPRNIIRNNIFLDSSFSGIQLNAFSGSSDATGNRIYHNVFVGNGFSGSSLRAGIVTTNWGTSSFDVSDTAIKNNIFTKNNNDKIQIDLAQSVGGTKVDYFNSGYVIAGNCLSSQPDISILSLNGRQSITYYQNAYSFVYGNHISTPQFIDATKNNYELTSQSGCRNSGVALTNTRSSGSGVDVPLIDAKYFMDGKSLVSGDYIKIGGNAQVMIIGVNYETNTVKVDRSISWAEWGSCSLTILRNGS